MLAEAKALRGVSMSPTKAAKASAKPKAPPPSKRDPFGLHAAKQTTARRAASQRPPKVGGSMTEFFHAAAKHAPHAPAASPEDQVSSLGDAESSLGDAKSSLGDAKSSLGDVESSLGERLRARWVTLRARWVTLRARWVTLRARWVTL
jgi:hypothetical protein